MNTWVPRGLSRVSLAMRQGFCGFLRYAFDRMVPREFQESVLSPGFFRRELPTGRLGRRVQRIIADPGQFQRELRNRAICCCWPLWFAEW